MKLYKWMAFLFMGCFLFSAEASPGITQFIAKPVDGKCSEFSFFYRNTTDHDLRIDGVLTNGHRILLRSDETESYLGYTKTPSVVYPVPPGVSFFNYDIFEEEYQVTTIRKNKRPLLVRWHISSFSPEIFESCKNFFVAWDIQNLHTAYQDQRKDSLFADVIKLLDEKNLTFVLMISNHTKAPVTMAEFPGPHNTIKLKFPSGKVYEHPVSAKGEKISLKPGESKFVKIDLEELLKESKEFSMKDFEYGLTELVWEVKLDDGKVLTRNFWLVKFNGELPKDNWNGYKLDGPLSLETFRDNKMSVLPGSKAVRRGLPPQKEGASHTNPEGSPAEPETP